MTTSDVLEYRIAYRRKAPAVTGTGAPIAPGVALPIGGAQPVGAQPVGGVNPPVGAAIQPVGGPMAPVAPGIIPPVAPANPGVGVSGSVSGTMTQMR